MLGLSILFSCAIFFFFEELDTNIFLIGKTYLGSDILYLCSIRYNKLATNYKNKPFPSQERHGHYLRMIFYQGFILQNMNSQHILYLNGPLSECVPCVSIVWEHF